MKVVRLFEPVGSCYIRSCGLRDQDIVDDLVLCSSVYALRLEVTSELGDTLEGITEEDLMEAIKRMAVLVSNPYQYGPVSVWFEMQGYSGQDTGSGNGVDYVGGGHGPRREILRKV